MKILHVIQNIAPMSGGPVAVVVDLAAQQMRDGHHVTIVSATPARDTETSVMLETRWAGCNPRPEIRDAPRRKGSTAFCVSTLASIDPDIVHLHGIYDWSLRLGARWARSHDKRLVCSTHGMLHPTALAVKRLKKLLYLRLFGDAVRLPHALLALNDEEADHAARYFKRSCIVMENGVDPDAFAGHSPKPFLETHPALATRPYALFVGRLHPIKGIDQLVRSFHLARGRGFPHALVCIGPDEGAASQIQSLISQFGLERDVFLLPPVYGLAKQSAIAGCSMFVHRPRYEGFGIAVLEAMAAGRPVVTTRLCRLERAIREGIIVPADNTDDGFADAMIRCAQNAATAEASAASAAQWVRRNLSWREIAARTMDVYAGSSRT